MKKIDLDEVGEINANLASEDVDLRQ